MLKQELTAPNVNNSSEVQRNKLHKVTIVDDYENPDFELSAEEELKHLKRLNEKVRAFILEKGLFHELHDFINSNTF